MRAGLSRVRICAFGQGGLGFAGLGFAVRRSLVRRRQPGPASPPSDRRSWQPGRRCTSCGAAAVRRRRASEPAELYEAARFPAAPGPTGREPSLQNPEAAKAGERAKAVEDRRRREREPQRSTLAGSAARRDERPENVSRLPIRAASSSACSISARSRSCSSVSPGRGAASPSAATSKGSVAPKRPSGSSVHRKRDFGVGGA